MLRKFARKSWLAILLVLLAVTPSLASEQVLKLVPDGALGFVVIHGLATWDAKVQELGRQISAPLPSPLAMFKTVGGVGDGLDEKGDLGVLLLPGADDAPPIPVLLIPVTDYDKLLKPLTTEKAGDDLTKVTAGGKEALVRSLGGYAVVADPKDEKTLKGLAVASKVASDLTPWETWIAGNDMSAVALRPGIHTAVTKLLQGIELIKSTLSAAGGPSADAANVFEMYAIFFRAADKEISAAGLGLRRDEKGNLVLNGRHLLVPDGEWAPFFSNWKPNDRDLIAGLPDETFVVAGGVVVTPAAWEKMLKLSIGLMKSMPKVYGLDEEKAKALTDIKFPVLKGLTGFSVVMGVPESGKSLYSKMVGLMRVDNAKKFLVEYEKTMQDYNEVVKKVDSPILKPAEIEKAEVGGKQGLLLTMTMPQAPVGNAPPEVAEMTKNMMEKLVGPDGKLRIWVAPVNKQLVAFGYVDKAYLEQTIKAVEQGEKGLSGQANVAKTTALLPPGTPVAGYWSVRGTFLLANNMIATFGGGAFQLPEFPASPPVGFAVTAAPGEFQTHVIVPSEMLEAVGKYVATVKGK
jgi:hypothetical protein